MNRNRETWEPLVAVEGMDGAGTTTLVRLLSQALQERGIPLACGHEPTDGDVGQIIRQALSGRRPVPPQTLALLFAADRGEHLYGENGIQSRINEGCLYLTDRYVFSSLAYQSLDEDWDWVNQLNISYPLPGRLIYLDIPVEDALKRLSSRGARDIYETETLLNRVSSAYRRSISAYALPAVLELDARMPPQQLCNTAMDFILSSQPG